MYFIIALYIFIYLFTLSLDNIRSWSFTVRTDKTQVIFSSKAHPSSVLYNGQNMWEIHDHCKYLFICSSLMTLTTVTGRVRAPTLQPTSSSRRYYTVLLKHYVIINAVGWKSLGALSDLSEAGDNNLTPSLRPMLVMD